MSDELTLNRVTNPAWVAYLGEDIKKMCERIKMPHVNYYSIVAYLQQTTHLASDTAQLWVCMNGQEPVGFVHFYVKALPYVGTVHLDWIYSKKVGAARQMLGQFIQFAQDTNSPWLTADIINQDKALKHLTKMAEQAGLELDRELVVPFRARRK